MYGFEQRSVRRWQATGGLSLWVITYPAEQQEHWFPVYSRRLRSDALVPLMPLAEAKRRVVELIVALLEDA